MGKAADLRLAVGQRVRIARGVTRTCWGAPCNWGGIEATVESGGGKVQGVRVYAVRPDDCEFTGDFVEHVLEKVGTPPMPA